ncbi:MAG: efflux RND transporter permease subunit [Pseudomonadota bacterium]
MTGLVDWAASRARMVLAFIALSVIAGTASYITLPKEGEPDIEIPALFISVPFPGISAEDSEKLLIKPMETEMSDLDGLKTMGGTAAEGYAGLTLEFEFGWDKTKILADVRDRMNTVEAEFPAGAEKYSINEINFSEFPILVVNLTGNVPERTLLRMAKDLQDAIEGLEPVLEAALAGHRDEMLEVVIDPLRLETYNVTAGELINVATSNNLLVAAGEIETEAGAFSVKIPSSFDDATDVRNLPVKTSGDRVITLGDLATIRLAFEDRVGTARFNGEPTVALQVVKRKGFNIIDTVALVRATLEAETAKWPQELRDAITVGTSLDQSRVVGSMVSQLEGSVMTAIALVMIVVLAALGTRSALLVGFAIPTSFLLCFALLAMMGITISNIVMFGLILAVGMLVDGAIVVVEYADRRIREGSGPMRAFAEAAKRMFWPIVSSTATTLCAFLPMLFWPGVPGEFMGMLPVTLIFVLSASLVVALIYLPVMGGVAGRISRGFERGSAFLKRAFPWVVNAVLALASMGLLFAAAMQTLNPAYLIPADILPAAPGLVWSVPGAILFVLAAMIASVTLGAAKLERRARRVQAGYRRSAFGHVVNLIVGNPVMPLVAIFAVGFVVVSTFAYYGSNNRGVEFFVESEPEQAIVYVKARGNLSLLEKDALLRQAEEIVLKDPGVQSVFAFAGAGGLNQNTGGVLAPLDAVGQMQLELIPWEERPSLTRYVGGGPFSLWPDFIPLSVSNPDYDGDRILDRLQTQLETLPGVNIEILSADRGPSSGKPVHLRLKGADRDLIERTAHEMAAYFRTVPGLVDVEDTTPLPGIDWQIDVDVEKAGRYGADVALVGGMVQLVTRGILLDEMRVDSSDEEIEIRVRLPEGDRVLSTLDSLKVRTNDGLVPLSNFITREPVRKLAQINRIDQSRYYDVKADVLSDLIGLAPENATDTAQEMVAVLKGRAADAEGEAAYVLGDIGYDVVWLAPDTEIAALGARQDLTVAPVNANERIALITRELEKEGTLPAGISFEWTGDQQEQAESQAFLQSAFAGALGLMFVILLAQFNSFYNSVLVLLAVVLSTTGVLIGMIVWEQPFSIIMTGTGIVALAGIVVNNNIVLIDTYQEYSRHMPRLEAIVRTAEVRIRPVLLTTITTMAGLAPMMIGLSLDFLRGGSSIDSPTALWWKQLATAVVFGLGIATVLTLIFTPAMLALRVWLSKGVYGIGRIMQAGGVGAHARMVRADMRLRRAASKVKSPELIFDDLNDIDAREATGENAAKAEKTLDPGPQYVETIEDDGAEMPYPPLRAAE